MQKKRQDCNIMQDSFRTPIFSQTPLVTQEPLSISPKILRLRWWPYKGLYLRKCRVSFQSSSKGFCLEAIIQGSMAVAETLHPEGPLLLHRSCSLNPKSSCQLPKCCCKGLGFALSLELRVWGLGSQVGPNP